MIIKFDHISYVESRKNKKDILQSLDEKGYKYKFKEDMLINLPMKKALMEKSQKAHDIYYFEHGVEIPIELIFYSYVIKGILDRQDYWLVINLNKERDEIFLDQQGYGCITFIVNSFQNLCRCTQTGDYLSEADTICVNNQILKIVFYKSISIDIYFEFCIPVDSGTDMKRVDIE